MQTRMKWMLVLGVAVVTAACGDSKSSLLPTAPSALSQDAASVDASTAGGHYSTTGGSGSGNGNGGNGNGSGNAGNGGNGNGNQNGSGNGNGNQPPTNTSPSTVQFEGLIDAVGSSSITVNNQALNVTTNTVIRHGNRRLALADLKAKDRVHVRASRVGSAFEALEINLQNPAAGDDVATVPVPPPPPPDPDQVVTVTALDATASESGSNPGLFQLRRTGTTTQLGNPLTVQVVLSGSAASGTDFVALPPTVTFSGGASTANVEVTPVGDSFQESPDTLVLTLAAATGYQVGSPSSASMTLTDDPLPVVSVRAAIAQTTEGGLGRFVLTRSGSTGQELAVTITLTGLAQNGVDYEFVQLTQVFGVGEFMLTVNLSTYGDAVEDPLEDVVLTIQPGALYDRGVATATVTITGS